jgi:hypothetical protein
MRLRCPQLSPHISATTCVEPGRRSVKLPTVDVGKHLCFARLATVRADVIAVIGTSVLLRSDGDRQVCVCRTQALIATGIKPVLCLLYIWAGSGSGSAAFVKGRAREWPVRLGLPRTQHGT